MDAQAYSRIDSLRDKTGCLISTDPKIPTPVAWDFAHLIADDCKLLIDMNAGKIFGDAYSAARLPSVPTPDATH